MKRKRSSVINEANKFKSESQMGEEAQLIHKRSTASGKSTLKKTKEKCNLSNLETIADSCR